MKGKGKNKRMAKDSEEPKAKRSKETPNKPNAKGENSREEAIEKSSDFSSDAESKSGVPWNFKITSWNINGIRAWLEKDGLGYIRQEDPDVLCLQETKCSEDKIPESIRNLEGYESTWLSGDKDGYSGVGMLYKKKPLNITCGIGEEEHDKEGRLIAAEFDQFYIVNTYVPNSGRKLVRLDYRRTWNKALLDYLKGLDAKKPVILCGDLNVAHQEIDLANPKTNKRNAGFTQEERDDFTELLSVGFVDSFRELYPKQTGAYTFWTYMMNARAKNVGWRLDYFVLSSRLLNHLCDNIIRSKVMGSDHCPITGLLAL